MDGNNENIYLAKKHFKEAIKKDRDKVSLFNLSVILLNEEEPQSCLSSIYDIPIKLIIESSVHDFFLFKMLLCFVLLKKYEIINFEIILKEFKENNNESFELANDIFQIFESDIDIFMNETWNQEEYQNLLQTDFVYIAYKIKNLNEIKDNLRVDRSLKTFKAIVIMRIFTKDLI